jgi:hypothetical protein
MGHCSLRGISAAGCGIAYFFAGFRSIGNVQLINCHRVDPDGTQVQNSSSHAVTEFSNASGVGILLDNTDLSLVAGSVDNCGSHGIEAQRSVVRFTGAFAGTGNTGAGVYAHSGSVVYITDGSPPTLTGAVGDFAVSNPNYQQSTWAAVDGGDPVQIAAESTIVKEV